MGLLISFFAAFQVVLGFVTPVVEKVEAILNRLGIYKKHAQGVALTDMAKNTRVQPITVISKDLMGVPELENVLLNTLNVFCAYYIQAFSVGNIIVNGVSVEKILYKYNPNGSLNSFESFNTSLSTENYKYGLPGTISLEADLTQRHGLNDTYMRDTEQNDLFKYDANLSVGKLITLNLTMPMHSRLDKDYTTTRVDSGRSVLNGRDLNNSTSDSRHARTDDDGNVVRDNNGNIVYSSVNRTNADGHTDRNSVTTSNGGSKTTQSQAVINDQWDREISIPVLIQLSSVLLNTESVINLIAANSVDKSLSERWVQYRSGQIRFVQDLILCNDIIDEKKKLLLNDESDTYLNILKRIAKSQVNALLSEDGVSFASASNIYIISSEVAKEIEFRIGGKLSSARVREKLFVGNYGMILVVVDREWERATFYYRNMDAGTDVSFKSLAKSANGGKGSGDIYEIFKMFNNGGSPIF